MTTKKGKALELLDRVRAAERTLKETLDVAKRRKAESRDAKRKLKAAKKISKRAARASRQARKAAKEARRAYKKAFAAASKARARVAKERKDILTPKRRAAAATQPRSPRGSVRRAAKRTRRRVWEVGEEPVSA